MATSVAGVRHGATWASVSSVSGVATRVSGASWSHDSAPAAARASIAGSSGRARATRAHSTAVRHETSRCPVSHCSSDGAPSVSHTRASSSSRMAPRSWRCHATPMACACTTVSVNACDPLGPEPLASARSMSPWYPVRAVEHKFDSPDSSTTPWVFRPGCARPRDRDRPSHAGLPARGSGRYCPWDMAAPPPSAAVADPFATRRRVLHVAQPVDGGVHRYVGAVAQAQRARGWDVHVAQPAVPADRPPTHHLWPSRRSPVRGVRSEQAALAAIVDRVDPEVVVLHSSKAGLVGRLAVRGRRPTVFMPHAWSYLALPAAARTAAIGWERTAARWTSAIVAVSGAEADAGARAGITAPTYVVVNPGPDGWPVADAAERARARAALGLPDGPIAVCLARICRQKGQDVLLEAWTAVRRRCPTATLVLVGGGDLAADGAGGAARPDGVVLAGPTSQPRPHLAAADVVVVASRWEGCSLAMMEGLAMGRSVVTTRVFGSEVVAAAGAGAVVPVEDPDALAAALADRLGDPARAAAEGGRGAEHVGRHHRFDDVVTALSGVIAHVHAHERTG